jgi:hypothetical protein
MRSRPGSVNGNFYPKENRSWKVRSAAGRASGTAGDRAWGVFAAARVARDAEVNRCRLKPEWLEAAPALNLFGLLMLSRALTDGG